MEKGVEKEVGWSTEGKGQKGRVSQTQRAGRSHSVILTLVGTPPFSSAPILLTPHPGAASQTGASLPNEGKATLLALCSCGDR